MEKKEVKISLKVAIIMLITLIIIITIGIILINKCIVNQSSNNNSVDSQNYSTDLSNYDLNNKSKDFEEKKELINDLNNKFYNKSNVKNYYIINDYESYKIEIFVLNDKAKTYTTWYKTDSNGNVHKDEIFIINENIIIDNLQYFYTANYSNNNINKKINKLPNITDTEEAWCNYIFPSKNERKNMSKEQLNQALEIFINSVKIERNGNNIIFTLNSNLDFFNCNTNYEKKILVIDYETGCPISITYYNNEDKITSTTNYKYKTNCCTERDFDISNYQGIKIDE